MKTGLATLPLHGGKAPRWLFTRMRDLGREIATAVIEEFGPEELLLRLSDPFWFQALGCVLAFDWHSSGVTTTVCGALKEGLTFRSRSLGFYVAGGKGGASRKTPQEIEMTGRNDSKIPAEWLTRTSRLVAKVDSACIQDGYQLYHHTFFFTRGGNWCVVQQGMNDQIKMARRYHWLGNTCGPLPSEASANPKKDSLPITRSFVVDPHAAVCCDVRHEAVLNLVAGESHSARAAMVEAAVESADKTLGEMDGIAHLQLPKHHAITWNDLDHRRFKATLQRVQEQWIKGRNKTAPWVQDETSCEAQHTGPADFERLLEVPGVGPKTLKALSLVAEIVYGARSSFRDPARFSYAHGGKDGYPFPVDRTTYDRSIGVLRRAIACARLGRRDRLEALKALGRNSVPFPKVPGSRPLSHL